MDTVEAFLEKFSEEDVTLYQSLKSDIIDFFIICKSPLGKLKTKILGREFHHAYLLIIFKRSKRMIHLGVGGIHLQLKENFKVNNSTTVHVIKVSRKLTLENLFQNYVKKFSADFVYTPSENNCQMFVHRVLTASKLLKQNMNFSIFNKGLHKYMQTKKPRFTYLFNKFTNWENNLRNKTSKKY